jgi:methionine-R-sulfoxide reductase
MLNWQRVCLFSDTDNPAPTRIVNKSDDVWRAQLSNEQYRITRQHGTEPPYRAELCSLFEPGIYACVCCGSDLFDAQQKFESGTGWPSFTQPITDNAIAYVRDNTHGMLRMEAVCNVCRAHLGHVFPDGPTPSGLRYCMNAVALQKMP